MLSLAPPLNRPLQHHRSGVLVSWESGTAKRGLVGRYILHQYIAHVTAVLISDTSTNRSAISDLQQHNNLSNHLATVNKVYI